MRVVVVAVVLSLAACSLDTRVPQRAAGDDGGAGLDGHGGALDAAPMEEDAGAERVDGGPTEEDGGVDAGHEVIPDAGEPDAPPDPEAPPCGDLYGGTSAYSLCDERETECEFWDVLGGSTCRDRCERAGGECVTSWVEAGDPPYECDRVDDVGCDWAHNDAICICTRFRPR